MEAAHQRSPWWWIPTLYFGQGIPYVVVMTLTVVMYKNTGVSNTDIALYTAWLYLPWVIKPLWSPVVELFGTKRVWIVLLQLLIGAALALVALTTKLPDFFQVSLAVLWLLAFSSATHDIAADGFYMLGLRQQQQAAFVGVRSTFYRLAMISGQGGLVYLAGQISERTGDPRLAWSVVFFVLAALFILMCVYHQFMLPRPAADVRAPAGRRLFREFFDTFASFFRKQGILVTLGYLLLFRLGEAQLLKLAVPFLLDPADKGGLGLTTSQVGLVYGTIGISALTLGGLLGGFLISRYGLKRCLWPMAFAIHIPDLVFVYLSTALPQNIYLISVAMAVEQFGYGLGFTSYMLYMIMVADGPHKTAHYAICTGFMALGMMLPQMASGWIQQMLGYQHFFLWVCLATIPAFAMTALLKVDPAFGREG
ncbi:MFS transporter [Pseudoduganella namucuonensis]|uniref:MFS transporter, PAT family, beta-lactamase induction signal transducer AmpG n=1 Tax=Pseudoduganella namucuonensis TaxID=1035707 RepID=A0A1I7M735_9BURK|nr:MFS transporter [Pseudoduganella namucuonensis]SFV17769.1 MFS transporter, PAT family, beta-lactamase induction signal transducer AmpG [Pseudoduganella namucuonensis]